MIRAALLDADGVYLRMDELTDPGDLTARHLPQIQSCDLPSGQYRWIADENNPLMGAFWPIKWLERVQDDKAAVIDAGQKAAVIEARRVDRKIKREAREAREKDEAAKALEKKEKTP
jgi:hypothetical protein